ncbi:phosphodiesterase [Hymenobacter sp. 15J16-1T3B]|uniref:phosphodiesterase n=1 Tax=Hymenobacter sp. 15J16-1T3B TaxID=2886941 RepID=UPI001D0FE359|nr:phosphodiesterase [Hymenobacter sp. 15J16-1T3B]MCC3157608.1 phosphodiesterase [Hymenobacter sp. 15J16-1T3B]
MIIAQLSDTHINDESPEAAARLRAAVTHLLHLPAVPDVVLITGDCTEHGSETEYAHFRELLRPLTIPVYVIPGNHDDRPRLRALFGPQGAQAMPDFVQYTVEAGSLRLLALDTHVPGQDGGTLCPARLQWLEERLSEQPERPTIILMHHPPFRCGLAPFDGIGLDVMSEFGTVVARHPQVERVLAGHLHMGVQRPLHGALAVVCPSTLHQLLPDFRRPRSLEVSFGPPAMLLHTWAADTGLLTHSSLIAEPRPVLVMHDGQQWQSPPWPVRG